MRHPGASLFQWEKKVSKTKSLLAFVATLTLAACGGGGDDSGSHTHIVPVPSCTFAATPPTVNQGAVSTLSWTTQNASAVFMGQSVTLNGTQSVTPSTTSTYVLMATGAGGTKSCTLTVTVIPSPQIKDATLRMQGGFIEAAAGETSSLSLVVDCPRLSPGSTRCAKLVGPVTLSVAAAGVPIDKIGFTFNDRVVNPGTPLNIEEAGTLKIGLTIGLAAVANQPGPIIITATTNGLTTIEVVGTPATVRVVREAAKIANASPATFSKAGYGEMSGFDIPCPLDTAPHGCLVKGMTQSLTGAAASQQVNTYIGQFFWWQYPTIAGVTSYTMNSTQKVDAGTTVRISVRSALTQGTLMLTNFEFVRAADGLPIPLLLPTNVCGTIVAGLGCKG